MPRTNPVSVCGYHIRESGATPAQEMAYAFLHRQRLHRRGRSSAATTPEEFVGRFSFNLNIFGNLWEQVAKFRAGRKVWATNLRDTYGRQGSEEPDAARPLRRRRLGPDQGRAREQHHARRLLRPGRGPLGRPVHGALLASTRPTRSPPSARRCCRCAPCRSSWTRWACATPSIRWPARTSSRRSPSRWKRRSGRRWRESRSTAAWSAGIKSGYVQRKLAWQAYEFERDVQHGELIKVGVNKYVTSEEEEVELHEYNEAWARVPAGRPGRAQAHARPGGRRGDA